MNQRRPRAVDKENQAMASKPSNPETRRRTTRKMDPTVPAPEGTTDATVKAASSKSPRKRAPGKAGASAAEPTILRLPLVALRETVIFPEMIVPLQVGRDKSVAALNAAVANGGPIALVTQRSAEMEDITDPSQLYEIGTLAKIAQVV